jgi:23S rRNA pseudouridine1911/1915/1917 synthase
VARSSGVLSILSGISGVAAKQHRTAQIFHVQPEQAQQTLAAALRGWLPGQPSWGDVRRLVKARQVQIDGNLCLDVGRRLKPKEVVRVLAHSAAPLPREEDVRVRFLDRHLVVVEKPSGMTSVRHAEERDWAPKRKRDQPTLEDLLPRILAKKEGGKNKAGRRRGQSGPVRGPARTPPVRPVHRLDRETSGLMVFARTVPAERHLGQQFRKHTTRRKYLAVVHGAIEPQVIESQLVRDRGDGRRGSTKMPGIGKRAVTHVTPIERLDGYTLVECRLETGRTHQIRIHLAELGHPVCGERVYHQPLFGTAKPDASGAPRVALHAAELSFEHPVTGQPMEFEMPLPEDLVALLRRLREGRRAPTSTPKRELP